MTYTPEEIAQEPENTPDKSEDYPEDNAFLNDIDAGYIGFTKPKVVHTKLTAIERLQALQGDWPESDNWAGDPEQARA